MKFLPVSSFFFFFNDTATTEIYTLSLHDALPIYKERPAQCILHHKLGGQNFFPLNPFTIYLKFCSNILGRALVKVKDRKSTRLNSSHANISYAVFCLKKKKHDITTRQRYMIC